MTGSPVGIGIVGAGNISQLNVPGYLGDDRCRVQALCDPRLDHARALADKWGIPRVYATLEELLADDGVDAVEILSPTQLHVDHVTAAARAGKHISCQKPIATSVADARGMAAACAEAGVLFRITENCCHYPPLELARQAVRDGAIGAPMTVRIKTVVGETDSKFQAELDPEGYTWRFDANSPGGHLFDDVIHKYAMALWLVGEDITSVQSVVRKGRLFFEAPMVALFEYARPDLLGTMEVTHAPGMFIPSDWYGADEFFEIQGTTGFVWVTRLSGRLLDLPPVVIRSGNTTTNVTDVDADYQTSFRRAASAFVDGIVSGEQPDLAPDAAIKTLQLAFAVYQSSNEGRPVDPAQIEGSVSPTWWPKAPLELIEDAAALGLLPDGMSAEDAQALLDLAAD
ncbi:MAG TPA: Gfo/Idh/MocA family oxidoreductase [Acidimicrobiales bacterium]|nr:Gfo/Idh/MocA family oxidoreductase [Acidimicrobiales bacterium]